MKVKKGDWKPSVFIKETTATIVSTAPKRNIVEIHESKKGMQGLQTYSFVQTQKNKPNILYIPQNF